ncbi:MAG: hypothetical protein LBG42_04000, partial [Treponema sp.]|nr:hypothetical protein [Treponema sp.]
MIPGVLWAEHTALWAGSWEHGKNLANRGELRFSLPMAFALRTVFMDRRPQDIARTGFHAAGFGGGGENGLSAFSGGLYHNATGTRLLWGSLDELGLSARVGKPW